MNLSYPNFVYQSIVFYIMGFKLKVGLIENNYFISYTCHDFIPFKAQLKRNYYKYWHQ